MDNNTIFTLKELRNINGIIECIYDEKLSLSEFMSEFMSQLREEVYFDKSDFMFFMSGQDPKHFEIQSFSPINWSEDEITNYIDTYMHMDDVLPILSQQRPIAFRNEDLFCLEERKKTKYYQEFVTSAKLEISIDANIPLSNELNTVAILGLFRDPGRKDFSLKELETIRFLQNHLAHGMEKHLTRAKMDSADDMFASLNNFESLGICIMDSSRSILSYNTTFKKYALQHGSTLETGFVMSFLNEAIRQLDAENLTKVGPNSVEIEDQIYWIEVSRYEKRGERYICIIYSLSDIFVRRLTSLKEKCGISNREFEILYLMLKKGFTNEEIANHLFISPATVKRHIATAYRKAGINNQKQLLNMLKII